MAEGTPPQRRGPGRWMAERGKGSEGEEGSGAAAAEEVHRTQPQTPPPGASPLGGARAKHEGLVGGGATPAVAAVDPKRHAAAAVTSRCLVSVEETSSPARSARPAPPVALLPALAVAAIGAAAALAALVVAPLLPRRGKRSTERQTARQTGDGDATSGLKLRLSGDGRLSTSGDSDSPESLEADTEGAARTRALTFLRGSGAGGGSAGAQEHARLVVEAHGTARRAACRARDDDAREPSSPSAAAAGRSTASGSAVSVLYDEHGQRQEEYEEGAISCDILGEGGVSARESDSDVDDDGSWAHGGCPETPRHSIAYFAFADDELAPPSDPSTEAGAPAFADDERCEEDHEESPHREQGKNAPKKRLLAGSGRTGTAEPHPADCEGAAASVADDATSDDEEGALSDVTHVYNRSSSSPPPGQDNKRTPSPRLRVHPATGAESDCSLEKRAEALQARVTTLERELGAATHAAVRAKERAAAARREAGDVRGRLWKAQCQVDALQQQQQQQQQEKKEEEEKEEACARSAGAQDGQRESLLEAVRVLGLSLADSSGSSGAGDAADAADDLDAAASCEPQQEATVAKGHAWDESAEYNSLSGPPPVSVRENRELRAESRAVSERLQAAAEEVDDAQSELSDAHGGVSAAPLDALIAAECLTSSDESHGHSVETNAAFAALGESDTFVEHNWSRIMTCEAFENADDAMRAVVIDTPELVSMGAGPDMRRPGGAGRGEVTPLT